jgi:DNA polymerase III subunit gamma/tau
MDYKVLSRKYRPQKFNEIIGQPHVVDTLTNSISSERLAHGYLFSGLRGVGKTTTARVLSKTLNCIDEVNDYPCEKCQNCIEITGSRSLDVIELDGASNRGIDEIREIKETVKYPPISSKYKIFIIDEVHMLTKEAFNALLKTLEEPPKNVIFILATTDSHKIPDTILSRTLRFDFKRISNKALSKHMSEILEKENIKYEENALNAIAFKADGSVRDSLSILDRIISYSDQLITYDLVKDSLGIIESKVYLDLLNFILKSDQASILKLIKKVIDSGYSTDNFISGFNTFLSNCLVCISGYTKKDFIDDETQYWVDKNRNNISSIDIMRIIEQVQDYELKSKYLLQPNIALESLFLKLSVMGNSVKISDLLNKFQSISNQPDVNNIIDDTNIKSNVKSIDKKLEKINKEKEIQSDAYNIKEDINNKINSKKPITMDNKIDFDSKRDEIIKLIDSKDKRISHALDDANINIENQIVVIDLGKTDNSFLQKTLNDNSDLIQSCIFEIMETKYSVEIRAEIKIEEEEKDHPLLSEIKTKFTRENKS